MTRRLLAVSPHLDDAAFSAGGTLGAYARDGWAVTVLTCFTGNVESPTGFALACQLDKGLSAEVDYMALRRAEDRDACAAIGAEAIHLPFLEAPHRGYQDAPALFGARRADDNAAAALAPALAHALEVVRPDLVLGPLAIGDHVDHHVVRDALKAVDAGRDLLLWEDWPYSDRPDVRRPADPTLCITLDDDLRAQRTAMCAAYGSQIGFQFGSPARMAERLAAIGCERLHRGR